ncbi:Lipase [Hondaea fermentalgiana]|uniref:Lipase n=1 Tax=Hondaea fermentalgiana TaxID=2315210 RepID=A0A2R5GZQ1_9STRA|nr:Lipase [Hondaea fermentalgiana]|eukprot:GBG33961.1 Lipase [Hondaea fermentalgiana]
MVAIAAFAAATAVAAAGLASEARAQETVRGLEELDFRIAQEAWAQIENATYDDELAVIYENDRVQVTRTNDTIFEPGNSLCWIVSEETNDAEDWVDNLDLGKTKILSIEENGNESGSPSEECGCAFSFFGWCLRYNTCDDDSNGSYKTLGKGFSGFVNAYNGLRHDVWERVEDVCDMENDVLMIAGYSRGGALANLFGFAVYSEGLWDPERMASITFGSPRVLVNDDSDKVHNQYYQLRLVYRDDPVPAFPMNNFGFEHFGEMHCFECQYEESRDAPSSLQLLYASDIDDHTSYEEWFD